MAETGLLPAAVKVAVAWAKQNAAIAAICSDHVSSRLPAGIRAQSEAQQKLVFPWLRVFRAGGAPTISEVPEDAALLQFDSFAFGTPETPQADIDTADLLISTVRQQLRQFEGAVPAGGLRAFAGGVVNGVLVISGPSEIEEPQTGWARMRMDTLWYIKEDVT